MFLVGRACWKNRNEENKSKKSSYIGILIQSYIPYFISNKSKDNNKPFQVYRERVLPIILFNFALT